MAPNPLKELKVKCSVVVRMDKEVKFYQKEAIENEAIVKTMEDDGKDAYDTKQARECLQESYMMIPDSKNRFQKSLEVSRATKMALVADFVLTHCTNTDRTSPPPPLPSL